MKRKTFEWDGSFSHERTCHMMQMLWSSDSGGWMYLCVCGLKCSRSFTWCFGVSAGATITTEERRRGGRVKWLLPVPWWRHLRLILFALYVAASPSPTLSCHLQILDTRDMHLLCFFCAVFLRQRLLAISLSFTLAGWSMRVTHANALEAHLTAHRHTHRKS